MRKIIKDWCKKSMNFADLKAKEIISVTNGKKLGYPDDVILDTETNSINYFVITKPSRMFKKTEKEQIPFSAVTLIGEDVILVKTEGKSSVSLKKETEGKSEFFYTPKVFRKADKE